MFNKIKKTYKQKIVFNVGLQFVERIVNMLLLFISSTFMIRYFLPIDYGVFAYASSYVTLFAALTTMGINSITVRELVEKQIPEGEIIGSSFIIMLLGSVVTLILAMGGSLFANNNLITNWVIFIYLITNIVTSLSVINFYFQAKLKTNLTSFALLIQDCIDFTLRLTLIYLKAELIWFAIASFVNIIVTYLILYLLYRRESFGLKWSASLNTLKYLFKQAIPLAISGVMINLFMRLDQVMLEHYWGLKYVAEYNVGVKLTEMVYILPTIIVPNIFPLLVKLHTESELKFEQFFIQLLRYFICGAAIIAIFFFICGPTLVHLLYGIKYNNAGTVLRWVSICILPVFIGVISALWLQIKKLQSKQLNQMVIGLIVCISLNLLLIPRYASMGAVIGIIAAQFSASVLSPLLFKDLRPLFSLYLKIFRFEFKK